MRLDQSIEIQLVNGRGEPLALANVMIDLSFFTRGTFRYRFSVGRTGDSGRLTVSYADVEAIRAENAEFHLMDYNTRLEECDSRVEIVIDSEEELRRRYDEVLHSYRSPPLWARNWPSNVRFGPQKKSVELVGPQTHVEVSTQSAFDRLAGEP